jgi:GNAT superfamily N-acetyltransferase
MTRVPPLPADAAIAEARPEDALAIAEIHLAARRQAMPCLRVAHTDDETRNYFAGAVCDRPHAWWVVRHQGQVAAYMLIDGGDLDHLYVGPAYQGQGFGSALLAKAKTLSPRRLELWTFQRNARARAFYEARGFRAIRQTDGKNEEGEPDVQYEWRRAT